MGLLAWIAVGLVIGWLVSRLMKGRGSRLQSDLIVGVVGALFGGFLATILLSLQGAVSGLNLNTIGWAFLGAVIFLAILQASSRRNRVL